MTDLMQQLSTLRNRDAIRDIDFELGRFLRQRYPDLSENVLLAAALVSYLYRQGDVCLLLDKYAGQPVFGDGQSEGDDIVAPTKEQWIRDLRQSPVVGAPGDFKPLILDEAGRLYMHKLWHYENELARQLIRRSRLRDQQVDQELLREGLERLFPSADNELDWQQVAAASAIRNKLSVISGGPGTGKTTTVVRVLALLLEQVFSRGEQINIVLAAPTGKAAARLQDSVLAAKQELDMADKIRQGIPDEAMTLHQLLGARRHSSSFKHYEENPVPYDMVVVDEASMVDQALMSKLMRALLDEASVILLGDKDQLASVEAGSVLGDICNLTQNQFSEAMGQWLGDLSIDIPNELVLSNPRILSDNITLLTKSYRFGDESGIARLARAVNTGDRDRVLQVMSSDTYPDASLQTASDQADLESVLRSKVVPYFQKMLQCAHPKEALEAFNEFRMLAAHRRGPWGIEYLNRLVEKILQQEGLIPKYQQWYPGKPVIINMNNYRLGLHNGDTGICLPDEEGNPQVYFPHEDSVRPIAPGRLPAHNKAFALTVHKSQGSEFDEVLLVLPDAPSKVLSRELIYTAITRARTTIEVLGTPSVLQTAIQKKLQRSSGLKDRLWTG